MDFSISSTMYSSKTLTNNDVAFDEILALLERADKARFVPNKGVNAPEQKIGRDDLWWVLPLLLAGDAAVKLFHKTRYVGSLVGNKTVRQQVLFSGFPEVEEMLA
jgi:hypothetical protein